MGNHLSDEQLAHYVDALVSDHLDQLPEEILEHVEECFECKVTILDELDLVEPDNTHPSFDIHSKQ